MQKGDHGLSSGLPLSYKILAGKPFLLAHLQLNSGQYTNTMALMTGRLELYSVHTCRLASQP